jgi:hypothetical protein
LYRRHECVFKEFSIEALEDLYAKLGGLWTYITDWASLRLLDDPNSARRSVHPLWACVQGAGSLLGDPAALCRVTASEATAPVSWYVPHILGCLVALAARLKLAELPEVLTALRQLAGEYLPEVTFTQRVQAEAIRLGLTGEQAGP